MFALPWSFWKEFLPEFISPLLWPPNSPDLNPVDCSLWSVLQEKVYKTRITHLDDLKHRIRIRTECAKLSGRHCCSCVSVASPSFILCQVEQWSFRALLLILTLSFCSNCCLWSLHSLVESNSWYFHLIFLQQSVMTLCVLMHDSSLIHKVK